MPIEPLRHLPHDEERQAGAEAEGGGVEGHRAHLGVALEAIDERLEARNEGAGETDAPESAERQRRPEAAGQKSEPERGQSTHERRGEVDATGIHPVGEAAQQRHGHHVTGEIDAAHPTRLGVRDGPLRQKPREQRWESEGAEHAESLGQAHDDDETGGRHDA
jgi:hypothetical protein